MVKELPLTDFRAVRRVLEPSDFAVADDGPEPPPSDLVSESTWHSIMDLPDDVAVRTTNHQGARIAALQRLTGAWTEAFPPRYSIVSHGMHDCYNAFQASLFNLLHGFYKEAIAALRNALETMVFAATCSLANDTTAWEGWLGDDEIWIAKQCRRLHSLPPVDALERRAQSTLGASMLGGEDGRGRKAWARDLYRRGSEFAHARGNASNAELWESNGPIYSAKGFRIAFRSFLETHALCLLLAKIGEPRLIYTVAAKGALAPVNTKEYIDAPFNRACDYYTAALFGSTPSSP